MKLSFKPPILILGLILLLGLFFRTYKSVEQFDFGHDADLYSWIVKDIVVDHHIRLIGQLTSAPGIFIGPLFYYSIIPFFVLGNMNPLSTIIFAAFLGLCTILSYYFVVGKLFNKETGLISAFLYSCLLVTINYDRLVVPTITTSIWAIWYLFVIVKISRRDFSVLPILGILVGLIWHIHIALIPTLIAIPVAFFISKIIPTRKQILLFFLAIFVTSIPLLAFELRHNFQQTIALFQNFTSSHEGKKGFDKLLQVLYMIAQNTNSLIFSPLSFKFTENLFFVVLLLVSPLAILKQKIIFLGDLIPIYSWVLGMMLFFALSSSPVSEYYFSNMQVIFIVILSILLAFLFKKSKILSVFVLSVLGFILIKNIYFITTVDIYHKGYAEKKAIIDVIKADMISKNYPCVGISYITTPGENVGFRYLLYLNNVHLNHPSVKIPVYNIIIPDELSPEQKLKFGHIGLILPQGKFENLQDECSSENTNLTDSVFGFVK